MRHFKDVTSLQRLEENVYVGAASGSQLPRTYGGHLLGHMQAAAVNTIPGTDFRVQSLHASFVAPGSSTKEATYSVTHLRDGRSFRHRRVDAMQDEQLISTATVAFHRVGDHGPEHQIEAPDVAGPDTVDVVELPVERTLLKEWSDVDFRAVEREDGLAVWMRLKPDIGENPHDHSVMLAYMSDMTMMFTAGRRHPSVKLQMASLDHSMWFARQCNVNEWLLYDQFSPHAQSGRSLVQGRFFDQSGRLVATTMQEGLTRTLREARR